MATCKCGNKKGWNDWECVECTNKKAKAVNSEYLEALKESRPDIYALCQKYDLSGGEFNEVFLTELTPDIEILEYAGGATKLVLTPSSIMKWEFALLSGRIKQKEIIPIATITGFEAKPPSGAYAGLWTFRITRAGNIDEVFVQEGKNVRPFIDAVSAAIANGGRPVAAAPAQSAADKIKSLAELRDAGVLTEEEFAAKKAELLKDF